MAGGWDERKDEFTRRVLDDLEAYAPGIHAAIVERRTITPLDIERDYGLTEGNIFHGAMFLDQLFSSRPLPELSSYRTPVAGYYLCGCGTHPGGGVMGAPGHNAAKVALADSGLAPSVNGRERKNGHDRGLVHRIIATGPGRRAGYALARRRAFRPLAKLAARTRGR